MDLLLQVPLGLWLVAVVVISAISYHSLKGLEGPLVSLDTATHGKQLDACTSPKALSTSPASAA